jgi:hypothetical protein
MVATVRAQVLLSLFTDFENFRTFKPDPQPEKELHAMLDQVIAWGGALPSIRLRSLGESSAGRRVRTMKREKNLVWRRVDAHEPRPRVTFGVVSNERRASLDQGQRHPSHAVSLVAFPYCSRSSEQIDAHSLSIWNKQLTTFQSATPAFLRPPPVALISY